MWLRPPLPRKCEVREKFVRSYNWAVFKKFKCDWSLAREMLAKRKKAISFNVSISSASNMQTAFFPAPTWNRPLSSNCFCALRRHRTRNISRSRFACWSPSCRSPRASASGWSRLPCPLFQDRNGGRGVEVNQRSKVNERLKVNEGRRSIKHPFTVRGGNW